MVLEPKIIGGVCLTAHPTGLKKALDEQIAYVKSQKPLNMPKRVLGDRRFYRLRPGDTNCRLVFRWCRNSQCFRLNANRQKRSRPVPGWYNNKYFDEAARAAGLIAESLNADAFSNETRDIVIDRIKKLFGQVDLVVYSLASPVRKDPDTGEVYKSGYQAAWPHLYCEIR